MIERTIRLDKERFNLAVGSSILNETPLTHKEACTMKSKLLPVTQSKVKLINLGYTGINND